jgi:peptidoglycan/LPS O-acetylase OafA/YrhL
MRGLAALIVYVSHIRLLFYPEYRDLAAHGPFLDAFYLVTKLGHAAVMVFFVLSGYLVGGSILKDMFAKRWHWDTYLVKRGTRLYIAMVPALFLTAFWDTGAAHFGASVAAHAADSPVGRTFISSPTGVPSFISNLFFLQTILSPPYGSNAALWSLSWEWWYYLLFPVLLMAAKSDRRLMYSIFSLLMVGLIGHQITLYFGVWLMGASIGLWPDSFRKRLNVPVLLLAMVTALTTASLVEAKVVSIAINIAVDFGLGLATTLLIGALVTDTRQSGRGIYVRLSEWFAAISYTLYVVHLPLLSFLRRTWLSSSLPPSLLSLPAVLTIFTVGLLYARSIWWLTEARTDSLREAISRMVAADAPERALRLR